tara:strand:- start:654 stop:2906 length:2253 start_codon:yes stop_codon:yes gene_type:complete
MNGIEQQVIDNAQAIASLINNSKNYEQLDAYISENGEDLILTLRNNTNGKTMKIAPNGLAELIKPFIPGLIDTNLITATDYTGIPSAEGWYSVTDLFANGLDTSLYNLDGTRVLSSVFTDISYGNTAPKETFIVYRKKAVFTPKSSTEQDGYIDFIYNTRGQFIGSTNTYFAEDDGYMNFDRDFLKNNMLPNTYFYEVGIKYGDVLGLLKSDIIYLKIEDTLSNIYDNDLNVLNIPFSFSGKAPDSIGRVSEVLYSKILVGTKVLSGYDITASNSTNQQLELVDRTEFLRNAKYDYNVSIYLEVSLKNDVLTESERTDFHLYNSKENIINLEDTDEVHSLAMKQTFDSIYNSYTGNHYYQGDTAIIGDFSGVESDTSNIRKNTAKYDIDLFYSAGSDRNRLRKVFSLDDIFIIVAHGSNDNILIDWGTQGELPENYVNVVSRAITDDDGSDPNGTSYGAGAEFNQPTLDADLLAIGADGIWSSSTEHRQSPATAIVSAYFKKLRDETGAPWGIIRKAFQTTASNANSYNIYRGFGEINYSAALTEVGVLMATRSLEQAEIAELNSEFDGSIDYADKKPNTPITKKDLQENPPSPNLQNVTTEGNATTNPIRVEEFVGDDTYAELQKDRLRIRDIFTVEQFTEYRLGRSEHQGQGSLLIFNCNWLSNQGTFEVRAPYRSGILPMRINGELADSSGDMNLNFEDGAEVNTINSDPTGVTGADQVVNIMSLTQAEYNAITTPNASTFYIITDA